MKRVCPYHKLAQALFVLEGADDEVLTEQQIEAKMRAQDIADAERALRKATANRKLAQAKADKVNALLDETEARLSLAVLAVETAKDGEDQARQYLARLKGEAAALN